MLQLYTAVPALLMQTHGPGFFVGESGLHVLAANRREEELCDALQLAEELLTTPQLVELLCVQAAGGFFRAPPSLFYGGTILGYAASFNLKEAVRAILCIERVASEVNLLNANECACKITGFLPLHAAAANGMTDMFDYLIGRDGRLLDDTPPLPEERRADRNLKTSQGERMSWSGLSALQLAAKLGDQRMCKHILRERLRMNWKWGPLTSLSLPLNEIESAYEQDAGLMELVAHFDARPATQAMLLDDFMQGFLHELFVQKWHRFGKYLFYSVRLVEITLLIMQLTLAFALKSEPQNRSMFLAAATLALAVLCTFYEAWVVSLWWSNEGEGAGASTASNLRYKLKGLGAWLSGFGIGRRICAYVLTLVGCAMYIDNTISGRTDAAGHYDEPLWTLFALGASFQSHAVISSLFVSPNSRDLGVFSITIDRMFSNDVAIFLVFLSTYILKYWVAMYISYPRAGTTMLPQIAPFDDPYQSLKALLDAAIYQRRFTTDWDAIDHTAFDIGHWVAMTLFTYFHLMFAITCMILLVRLLMAMMTNTFQSVKKQAQLEWRLLIARNVLRLELVFTALIKARFITNRLPLSMRQRKFSGAIPPGAQIYVHTFLHVERSTGAPDAVPLLLAQQGGNDLYDVEEQKAAAALQAKREARYKQLRAVKKGTPALGGLIEGAESPFSSSSADGGGAVSSSYAASEEREQLRAMLAAAMKLLDDTSQARTRASTPPRAPSPASSKVASKSALVSSGPTSTLPASTSPSQAISKAMRRRSAQTPMPTAASTTRLTTPSVSSQPLSPSKEVRGAPRIDPAEA